MAIDKLDHGIPVWLNILPNVPQFNPHTFELLARHQGMAVRPTSSRTWTVMGDQVSFTPDTALYYQWYLIKTGAQGYQFKDKDSGTSYEDLKDFVRKSGHFTPITTQLLPDGSTLLLYRRKIKATTCHSHNGKNDLSS